VVVHDHLQQGRGVAPPTTTTQTIHVQHVRQQGHPYKIKLRRRPGRHGRRASSGGRPPERPHPSRQVGQYQRRAQRQPVCHASQPRPMTMRRARRFRCARRSRPGRHSPRPAGASRDAPARRWPRRPEAAPTGYVAAREDQGRDRRLQAVPSWTPEESPAGRGALRLGGALPPGRLRGRGPRWSTAMLVPDVLPSSRNRRRVREQPRLREGDRRLERTVSAVRRRGDTRCRVCRPTPSETSHLAAGSR